MKNCAPPLSHQREKNITFQHSAHETCVCVMCYGSKDSSGALQFDHNNVSQPPKGFEKIQNNIQLKVALQILHNSNPSQLLQTGRELFLCSYHLMNCSNGCLVDYIRPSVSRPTVSNLPSLPALGPGPPLALPPWIQTE